MKAIVALLLALPMGGTQLPLISPIETNKFERVSTHQELMEFLASIPSETKNVSVETIGNTAEGRPIPLVKMSNTAFGSSKEKLRILLFCSQHGNEPSGKEAALILVSKCVRGELDDLLAQCDILVIPSVNPDGNEAKRRYNATGADLNRNHLILNQPEVQAVHRIVREWEPEMTLDVHEFGVYGKSWERAGYVRSMDEQFGAPTNLNVSSRIVSFAHARLFPFLDQELRTQGIRFFNYALVDSPGAPTRHSTTSINDGRQSLAILNSFSFILEGRNGKSVDDDLKRRTTHQLKALEAFLRFGMLNATEIKTLVRNERNALASQRDSVVLQMEHTSKGETIALPVRTLGTGRDSVVYFPYTPSITPLLTVTRPQAYIIDRSASDVIRLLERHQIPHMRIKESRRYLVDAYTLSSLPIKEMEGKKMVNPDISVTSVERLFEAGDVIVPLNHLRSTMLVIAFEPQSMWGLVQYDEFPELRVTGREYPIYRLMENTPMGD